MSKNNIGEIGDNDIVISGIAGYFPESLNVDQLEEKLFNNGKFITLCDFANWNRGHLDIPKLIGRLPKRNEFDSSFFGINNHQASTLDPMTRNMIERSFEAIIDSGLNPEVVKNTRMGIVMGSVFSESENMWIYQGAGFGILGHSRTMLANRVSYWLNCYGPSYALVSGDTNGIEALTLASEAIRNGQCESALVGAVSFEILPEMSHHYKELKLLAKDGNNRSFDDDASGIVRSEASVVMFLQKAKDAKRIYASIVHSQFECYGDRKSGYIVPLEYPLTSLLSSFYQRCGIDPSLISYLEADGSGIKARDTIELNAVAKVLLKNRQSPLLIGSIKSNLGHTSAAAALISVVKVLIAMEAGKIPANNNFNKPSQQVPALVEGRLKVVTETMPWSGGLAAVNAVGLSGVVGHILLRSYNKEKVNGGLPTDDLPRLLVISGRTEEGLKDAFNKLESRPVDVECVRLLHDLYSLNIQNYNYKGYTILGKGDAYKEIKHFDGMKRPVWFIFSGMGSQWSGMGTMLLKFPIISDSILRSHNILKGKGLDLLHIITTVDIKIFNNILHSFVGITAIQIALVDFMKALNIIPDGYVGHSVGELGCAYMDGCFTAEETILAAYYRGLASIETDLIPGYMAAVGLGYNDIKSMCPPEIDVACHNSLNSSTISGPENIVKQFVKELTQKNIFARAVNVANIAYHSRYIKPAAPKLLEYLRQLITEPKLRSSKWVSSSIPESEWESSSARYSSAEYHTNNLLNSVLFEESTKYIPNNAVAIEIAPHGLLQAIIKKSFGQDCIHIPLTLRGHPNAHEFLLASVGKMFAVGLLPKVSNLYPPVQYPVSRGTASLSSLVAWNHTETWLSVMDMDLDTLEGISRTVDPNITISLNQEQDRMLEGHKIFGKVILPVSCLLQTTWKMYCQAQRATFSTASVVFQNIHVYQHLEIPEKGVLHLSILLQRGSGLFEVLLNRTTIILSGRILISENVSQEFSKNVAVSSDLSDLSANDVYNELENRGYQYKDQFRGILNAKSGEKCCVATVQWTGNWCSYIDSLIQLVLFSDGEDSQNLYLPSEIQQIIIDPTLQSRIKDIDVIYQKTTGIIRGGGVELRGLKTSPAQVLNNEYIIKLESVKFLSHTDPGLLMPEQFLEVSMQLVFENKCLSSNLRSAIVEVDKDYPFGSFLPAIKSILRKTAALKADVKTVSYKNGEIKPPPNSNTLLIITPISDLDKCGNFLDNKSIFVLARGSNKEIPKINHGLVLVMEQQFDGEKLLLLRKAVPIRKNVPVILLTGDDWTWLAKIKTVLNNGIGDCSRVFVAVHTASLGDWRALIKQLSNEPKAEKLRYIFVLDKHAPKFSLDEDFYQQQLHQDLLVNVYSDGSWGSFQQLPIIQLPQVSSNISLLSSLRVKNMKINHIGLNLRDPSIQNIVKDMEIDDVGHLELSGITDDGSKVMSVVQNKRNLTQKSLDPYLTWKIPETWSFEDAATVPLAYATAYHGMVQAAELSSCESVLVNAGHTNIGQAAIALALQIGSTVFTTVAESDHKDFLIKRFPQLTESRIFNLKTSFDISLMQATKGKGVKVVVNCLRGTSLHASLQCVDECGRFVQLGTADMEENTYIGMFMFLKNITVFGIALDNLFNASLAWKKELHSEIQKGINSGVVQPLERKVFTKQQALSALRNLSNQNYTGKVVLTFEKGKKSILNTVKETTKFVFDPKNSHLIIGTKFEDCLDLAEWLVSQEANKITIASKSPEMSALSKRRLFLLRHYHYAHILQLTANKISTLPGASSLIRNASNLGPLTTIFCIALNDATSLHNLDVASRSLDSLSHFVSLIDKSGEDVSKERFKAGLPILDVQWTDSQKSENIRPIIKVMDKLLSKRSPPFVYISLNHKHNKNFKEVSSYDETVHFLPSSLDALEGVGRDFLSKAKSPLVVTPSLSPGIGLVPEVPPIFIVPGIQDKIEKVLKPLNINIMYPTVWIKLPDCKVSLQESAVNIVKHMRSLQPVGPYNIVGVLWGGILSLELARVLKSQDQKTKLFLLDGAPETSQSLVRQLGTGDELQCNLITKLLDIESNKVQEEIIQLPDWKSRVDYGLSALKNISPQKKHYIASGLEATYKRIGQLLSYKPNDTLLYDEVHLVRTEGAPEDDNCDLHKYFQRTVNIHIVNGNHRSFLSNKITANIINDETLANISV